MRGKALRGSVNSSLGGGRRLATRSHAQDATDEYVDGVSIAVTRIPVSIATPAPIVLIMFGR